MKRSKRDISTYTDGRIEFDELYNGTYSYSRFRKVLNHPVQNAIRKEIVKTPIVQLGVNQIPNGIMSVIRMKNLASGKDTVSRHLK